MNQTELCSLIRDTAKCLLWKIHGGPYQIRGLPDLMGCCDGAFIGIEAKVYPDKITENQLVRLRQITASGGVALVATYLAGGKNGEAHLCIEYLQAPINIQSELSLLALLPLSTLSASKWREVFTSAKSQNP